MRFSAFAKRWMPKARQAQERLAKEKRLGSGGSYSYDQRTMRLEFTAPAAAEPFAVAKASILGSFSNESWMWAWANESVLAPVAMASKKVRALGEKAGWPELTTGEFFIDAGRVDDLLAATYGLIEPAGFYLAPSPSGFTAFVLHSVTTNVKAPTKRVRQNKGSRLAKKIEQNSVSIMLTTTSDVKKRFLLKDSNVARWEKLLSQSIADSEYGMPIIVRLSLGLFPLKSDWGKRAEKDLKPEYVKSSNFLVVKRNVDYEGFRRLSAREQGVCIKQKLREAFSDIPRARHLPAALEAAKLKSALVSAAAALPL